MTPTNVRFTFDQYGSPLCPVTHIGWGYADDEGEEHVPMRRACGEGVSLLVTCSVPIDADECSRIAMKDAGEWAVCSKWEVSCHAGHVLAVSDGEESAEDFRWDVVFGDALAGDPS